MGRFSISGNLTVDAVEDSKSSDYDVNLLRKELLRALETARSRFAIAIAEESKSTPWDLRRQYLDTADHMRRFVTRLRNRENREGFCMKNWISALEALREIPVKDSACLLCRRLRSIVAALE
jgi:hypothetical protein